MSRHTTSEQEVLRQFQEAVGGGVSVRGRWRITVSRADGSTEERVLDNIVTKDGLNAMAANVVGPGTGVNSAFRYIIVGTATSPGSLGSLQDGIGEVSRKLGATLTSSNEVAILVATWAGNVDGLTGVALGAAGVTNHASSGSGTFGNHVNSVAATLADSDFLKVQVEIQVGSHAL